MRFVFKSFTKRIITFRQKRKETIHPPFKQTNITCAREDGVLQVEAARLLLGRMQLLEQTDQLFVRHCTRQHGDMLVSPFSLHRGFPSSFLPSWHRHGRRSFIFSLPFVWFDERKAQWVTTFNSGHRFYYRVGVVFGKLWSSVFPCSGSMC